VLRFVGVPSPSWLLLLFPQAHAVPSDLRAKLNASPPMVEVMLETTLTETGFVAWVGVPSALIGLTYLVLVGRRLLPDRRPVLQSLDDPREYTVEMLVEPGSPLAGKSIEDAGLRHLSGMYLMEIERDGNLLSAVPSDERLQANDRVVFVGVVDAEQLQVVVLVQADRVVGASPGVLAPGVDVEAEPRVRLDALPEVGHTEHDVVDSSEHGRVSVPEVRGIRAALLARHRLTY